MNPVSNIHNRQENSLDNDIIRIENDQNRLENSTTNGNEFLMLNSSLNKLQRTIDKNIEKVEINRDYKLSKATSYNLWLDLLKTELRSRILHDIIDETIDLDKTLPKNEIEIKENLVKDIVIHRINNHYHSKIANINNPRLILHALKNQKKLENNMSNTSVRQRLWCTEIKPKESISEFINRFEEIVNQNELYEDVVPLTKEEIRSAFYKIVSAEIPEIRQSDMVFKQATNNEMTFEQLKNCLLQIEADKKLDKKNKEVVP